MNPNKVAAGRAGWAYKNPEKARVRTQIIRKEDGTPCFDCESPDATLWVIDYENIQDDGLPLHVWRCSICARRARRNFTPQEVPA